MIDRGISEEYVALWLDETDACMRVRLEQIMNAAMIVARYGAGGRSLIQIYEHALLRLGPTLAAEYLRRVLEELAAPTPIDDSLPPVDSSIWEIIYEIYGGHVWRLALKQMREHRRTSPH
jgi:hypothetical protein